MFRILLRAFRTRPVVAGGAMFCALLVIVGIAALGTSGATPAATPTRLPDTLTNPNHPFPTNSHLDPTTESGLHLDATVRVTVATRVASNPSARNAIAPTAAATVVHPGNVPGIIGGPLQGEDEATFHDSATVENFYRAFPDNNLFIVAAGTSIDDPQQGFVGVARYRRVGLSTENKSLTPSKHGSVHITAVNGSLVTLVATDGTTFTFDYATYTFR